MKLDVSAFDWLRLFNGYLFGKLRGRAEERRMENVYLMTMKSSDDRTREKSLTPMLCSFYPLVRGTISSLFIVFNRPAIPFKRL